ncbi:LacI family DNA-binding transcriptional regulator [Mesorhizobium sp. M3A.F.Ca.ET.174.01.1.1]|uniref:LacI family DNA-binding transcriptional regulator n=1 Tax=unclassified Mesorhizobium TaxID=325217 RepID=UPI001093CF6E|nr:MULTISPECIES: LacI family DNA-binding transcriptional regulator [unclassified Mesorhizobium]TGS82824.1 LacI family DNA-binding transcriptional regulator [Mesorhizobium sp. M3A.F.Ca.ET.175.01.1.1]TGT22779.1 LacI family DNA-binding transcriptional regulator [Mesorhizobium sp. M3A.F.Ca.ET.174.01.1.1]
MDLKTTPITLAEVADTAGVGESTVSRVLRNHGSFSEKTRARVMAAVDKLGYVPNKIAGALASTGTPLVAIIVPSLSNIVFADVLSGVTRPLELRQRQAVFAVTEYDLAREEALVAAVLAWRPAAVMLIGLEHTEGTRKLLRASGCRVLELLDIDGEPLDIAVGFSHRSAGRATAAYLVERGYTRMAYVGHDMDRDTRSAKRFEGFVDQLNQAGLALKDLQIRNAPSSVSVGKEGLASILGRSPDIQAVYFSNDDVALGGYFHCLAKGISVPDQLAIIGFNALDICRHTPQPIASILTRRVEIGKLAAELLLEEAPAQTVDVGFLLVPGETV